MEQRTKEWFDLRKGKLTASKAPVILGLSLYQTPFGLWEEELGLRDPQPTMPHMEAGLAIEDEAREYFTLVTGIDVKTEVVLKDNLFMASLDGYNQENRVVLEIKKNNKDYHEMAANGKVPDMHYCQMQHQLYVTGFDQCHYLSWGSDGKRHLVIVPRDETYIKKMVEKELEFKNLVDTFTPPPMTDSDYFDVSNDAELADLADLYKHYISVLKDYDSKAEFVKNQIREKIGDRSAKGYGFKFTKFLTKGRVDYAKMVADFNLSDAVEKYRKEAATIYRLSVE